jgi:hypothetical protein
MKIAIPFLLLTVAAFGRASPSFEVASVKQSGPNSRGNYYSLNHAGVSVENGTLNGHRNGLRCPRLSNRGRLDRD